MTRYCPVGHPQDQPYALYDRATRRGYYCGVCEAPLITLIEPAENPWWSIAAVVAGALIAVAAFWAWAWLS